MENVEIMNAWELDDGSECCEWRKEGRFLTTVIRKHVTLVVCEDRGSGDFRAGKVVDAKRVDLYSWLCGGDIDAIEGVEWGVPQGGEHV